jgi:hypothetical protein
MNIYSIEIVLLTISANSVRGIILKALNITYYIVTDTQFQELSWGRLFQSIIVATQINCNIYCHVQGVAHHLRNPVRTPLDLSDALYIVYVTYTVKPMDNVVRLQAI